jgi:ABC-type transporter Mla subunit MlaD
MARDANLKATITAKDDASKVIDKLVDKAEDLEKPVEMEVDADVAKVLGAFDQIATEAKATAAAADALGSALGPELASQADPISSAPRCVSWQMPTSAATWGPVLARPAARSTTSASPLTRRSRCWRT